MLLPTPAPRSEIQVTPLVDIVLVLLIVFLLAVPMVQQGHSVQTPATSRSRPVAVERLLVRVDDRGGIFLNGERLGEEQLAVRLGRALANRGDRVVFFAASGELDYERVAVVLDRCRASGAIVGIVFQDQDV